MINALFRYRGHLVQRSTTPQCLAGMILKPLFAYSAPGLACAPFFPHNASGGKQRSLLNRLRLRSRGNDTQRPMTSSPGLITIKSAMCNRWAFKLGMEMCATEVYLLDPWQPIILISNSNHLDSQGKHVDVLSN